MALQHGTSMLLAAAATVCQPMHASMQVSNLSSRQLAGVLHVLCNHDPYYNGSDPMHDTFELVMGRCIEQAAPQSSEAQQEGGAISSSTGSSVRHLATTNSQADVSGGRQMDPLSLPMHEVFVQVLATSVLRSKEGHAAALVRTLLALEPDKQPGA